MLLSDKEHIARKGYRCHRCDNLIEKGEKYHRMYGGVDRPELHDVILCKDCHFYFRHDDYFDIEAEEEGAHADYSW